jgi:UDP-N-acetylglucosamine--N-acetylmuramyl-(pentapeptide) pyrophosphoryl-undecaprenol N-acetylglucosamine transferase
MKNLKILVSGGGTGGHIFPAIAIAQALQRRFPDATFHFVGAKGKIEMKKVPEEGFQITGLWISGLQRSLTLDNLSFPFKLISSLWKARKIIKQFKPDVIIGVGGYASGAVLWMGGKMKRQCLIQEQNSFAGITNKILGKKVDTICVAYENMEKFFPKEKIIITGNPIRKEVIQIKGKREKAAQHFNLKANKKTILFVGGSLGALAINQSLSKNVELLLKRGYQVIWQTGVPYYPMAIELRDNINNKSLVVTKFIKAMDLGYAIADIIVSRAGAIAISEISAIGKPAIFVPLPTAAEDHQRMNALALVNNNAAEMVLNKEAEEKLIPIVIELAEDKERQTALSENILQMAITDADERIADEVIKLVKE